MPAFAEEKQFRSLVQAPVQEYCNSVLRQAFAFPEARSQCARSILNVINWMLVKAVSGAQYRERLADWLKVAGSFAQLCADVFSELNSKLLMQYVNRSVYLLHIVTSE